MTQKNSSIDLLAKTIEFAEQLQAVSEEIRTFLCEMDSRGYLAVGRKLQELLPQPPPLENALYDVTSKALLLNKLAEQVDVCRACPLHTGRRNAVFGTGNPDAALMLVGEGPGKNEDIQGVPFVGKAGQMLGRMLASIGISRESVYITNIVKCRPPGNRDPAPEEVAACSTYLLKQMEIIKPKAILCLGRPSAHALLKTTRPLSLLRQGNHKLQDRFYFVTYHPAYLLRNPKRKQDAWRDLKKLAKFMHDNNLGICIPPQWWKLWLTPKNNSTS